MTFDIDFTDKRTCFGIHGLAYGSNLGRPVNVEKTIVDTIGREFRICDDKLTDVEARKVAVALLDKFEVEVRKACRQQKLAHLSSNLDRLRDDSVAENLVILQRLVVLLSLAALLGEGVTFE